jgi:DNA-binding YbaB/EbfC family protein
MAKKGGFHGGMGGMGGGVNANMLKQVQKMQSDMLKTQEELEAREYTAQSGGGAVTAVASGKRRLVSLVIDKDAVDPEDIEMLQDIILAAANEALRQADEAMQNEMGRYTGGLNLF